MRDFMRNCSDPGQWSDGQLAGLGHFFVVSRAGCGFGFPNRHTARFADRRAVYLENCGLNIVLSPLVDVTSAPDTATQTVLSVADRRAQESHCRFDKEAVLAGFLPWLLAFCSATPACGGGMTS
jgi:hypothetical protein